MQGDCKVLLMISDTNDKNENKHELERKGNKMKNENMKYIKWKSEIKSEDAIRMKKG